MAETEVDAFLSYLAIDRHVSVSTQNQALNALVFFYNNIIKKPLTELDGFVRANRPKRVPVILTKDEVTKLLLNLKDIQWLMASLMYGTGMWLMVCSLLFSKINHFC